MDKNDPYKDVKDAAEELTIERLKKSNETVSNDLEIKPMVQAVTPNDNESKIANTGGVDVKGSPDTATAKTSDGFSDPKKVEEIKK